MTTDVDTAINLASIALAETEAAKLAHDTAYVASVEAMHATDTKTEGQRDNTATPYARLTLSDLLSDPTFTIDNAIETAVAVYKPLTPKGKPTSSLGGLANSGRIGNAMATRLKSIERIHRNIAKPTVRALVDLFIARTGCAKGETFGALVADCNKAISDASAKPVTADRPADAAPPANDAVPIAPLEAFKVLVASADGEMLADMLAIVEMAIAALAPAEPDLKTGTNG